MYQRNKDFQLTCTTFQDDAQVARDRLSTSRHNLTEQSRVNPAVQPPFKWDQISETAKHREILAIVAGASPQTGPYYTYGRYQTNVNEENWVARWYLWHSFRYRWVAPTELSIDLFLIWAETTETLKLDLVQIVAAKYTQVNFAAASLVLGVRSESLTYIPQLRRPSTSMAIDTGTQYTTATVASVERLVLMAMLLRGSEDSIFQQQRLVRRHPAL